MQTQSAEDPYSLEEQTQLVSEDLLGREEVQACPTAPIRNNVVVLKRSGAVLLACVCALLVVNSCRSLFHLQGNTLISNAGQLEQLPLLCCGSKVCLLSAPDSVCGTTPSPVICAKGDIAAQNSHGFGYCCLGSTPPCRDVCLDPYSRQMHLNNGGSCNGAAPAGFRASNTIMQVNLPWDPSRGVYQADGSQQAKLPSFFFLYGSGDFTLVATVALERITADTFTIFSKINEQFQIGFRVGIGRIQTQFPVGQFVIQQGPDRVQSFDLNLSTSNISLQSPHEYRFIRQSRTLFMYFDGMLAANRTFPAGIVPDLNSEESFCIGDVNGTNSTSALFSNMRSESFADFP